MINEQLFVFLVTNFFLLAFAFNNTMTPMIFSKPAILSET